MTPLPTVSLRTRSPPPVRRQTGTHRAPPLTADKATTVVHQRQLAPPAQGPSLDQQHQPPQPQDMERTGTWLGLLRARRAGSPLLQAARKPGPQGASRDPGTPGLLRPWGPGPEPSQNIGDVNSMTKLRPTAWQHQMKALASIGPKPGDGFTLQVPHLATRRLAETASFERVS